MLHPRPLKAFKVQVFRAKSVLLDHLEASIAITVASVRVVIIVTAKDPVSLVRQVLKKELNLRAD